MFLSRVSQRSNMKILGRRTMYTTGLDLGLHKLGICVDQIKYHELQKSEAIKIKDGVVAVDTGKWKNKSPQDRYIVKQMPSEEKIWWNSNTFNKPISPILFDRIYKKVENYFKGKEDIYVFDGYIGKDRKSCKKIRFVTEYCWQHHFLTNLFIRPEEKELKDFEPDFTIVNCSKGLTNDEWREMGLNSEAFVGLNIEKKLGIILGIQSAEEMQSIAFSLMSYWLPQEDEKVLTLNSSVNVSKDGKTILFMGCDGSGKTSLSADPDRYIIGDDQNGWDDDGLFSLEGGGYTRIYNLDKDKNSLIYKAIKERSILENVWVNPFGSINYNNKDKTENGRVSYPIYNIESYDRCVEAGHPSSIIFLTCDGYGVLPRVSLLSPQQAIYYFLSGYSSKTVKNERGVEILIPSFNPCFSDSSLLLHPTVYAKLLSKKLEKHNTPVYLVNTGWIGGSYNTGKRIDISITKQCIDSIIKGTISTTDYKTLDVFNLKIPSDVPFVCPDILDSRETWNDKNEYDKTRIELAKKFIENYDKLRTSSSEDLSSFGPQI